MNIRQAAINLRQARSDYEREFRLHLAHGVTRLDADRFWQLFAVFQAVVCLFRFGYARTNGIEQAADEFFRKALVGESVGEISCSVEEALQLAVTWQGLSRELYQPLFDVVQDRSDDAYGDLLDSLPLAGRDLVRQCFGGEFKNHEAFEQAVRDASLDTPGMADLILHGENYVAMALLESGKRYLALHLEAEQETPTWA